MHYKVVLEAISYAARSHNGQTRADQQTPYVAHPFRVMTILAVVFGVKDAETLATAVLHDSIEDTPANYDDIKQAFGEEIATSVAQLSKDMRLPKKQREEEFLQEFEGASTRVKLCKLGDMLDNLLDTDAINTDKLSSIVRKAESILSTLEAKDNPKGVLVEAAVEEVQSRLLEIHESD